MTGGTVFTSNGDGTYNTDVYSYSGNNGGNGNNSGNSSNNGSGSNGSGSGTNNGSNSNGNGGNGGTPSSCTSSGKGAPSCSGTSSGGDANPPQMISATATPGPCTSSGKGAQTCQPASCALSNGQVLANGQSITLYAAPLVPAGSSCTAVAELRTCTNGVLSGSAPYASCSAQAAPAATTPPIVSITATPGIVQLGGSSRISWDGGTAERCSVTGPGFSSADIRGSSIVSNIQEQSTYVLLCYKGTASATDKARVDIVPLWKEF